jgi:hypothetical protein
MNQKLSRIDKEQRDLLALVCVLAGDDENEEVSIANPVLHLRRHDDNVDAVPKGQPDGVPPVVVMQLVPGGGRGLNDCWKNLSNDLDQHLAVQTKCMTCGIWVRYHEKSEKVKAHLN